MTDEPLTIKIETADGEEFEIPAVECKWCEGTGIVNRRLTMEMRSVNSDEVQTVVMQPGDPCRFCVGRGKIGRAGGPPRPITPKSSEIN